MIQQPVLKRDTTKRLFRNTYSTRSIEVDFSAGVRPTAAAFFPSFFSPSPSADHPRSESSLFFLLACREGQWGWRTPHFGFLFFPFGRGSALKRNRWKLLIGSRTVKIRGRGRWPDTDIHFKGRSCAWVDAREHTGAATVRSPMRVCRDERVRPIMEN